MSQRVHQQAAYILHARPFRDSSQILDVLSPDHGKLSLVARGVRSPKSRLAGLLRPFQPLRLSWSMRTELGTLTGAEVHGRLRSLSGDALMAGYYLNELILYLLHRHDPQPEVFELYDQVLAALAAGEPVAVCLRRFEIELLRLIGYALNLETEAVSDEPLRADAYYEYRPGHGAVAVQRCDGSAVFSGSDLLAIAALRLDDPQPLRQAGRLMRLVIDYHLDGKELKTRKVLRDLHRGRLSGPAKGQSS